MVYGAIRSVIVALILFLLALLFDRLNYPNFAVIVLVGVMVFISGFSTGNRSGPGGAIITGFFAALLVMLLSYAFFRFAANSGDFELEYLAYSGLTSSAYFLIALPIAVTFATFILDRIKSV